MIGFTQSWAYPLIGLLCLVLALAIWLLLPHHRSRIVRHWSGGQLLVGLGMILAWEGGAPPEGFRMPLAELLVIAGLLSRCQALRLQLRAPRRTSWLVGACLGFVVISAAIRHQSGHPVVLIGFATLSIVAVLALGSLLAGRIYIQHGSTSALFMALSTILTALALFIHLVHLHQHASRGEVADAFLSIPVLGTLGGVAILVWDVSFMGLVLEKLVRLWLKVVARQARLKERQRLGDQLVQLERHRSFGLVAASLAHELNQPLTAILASAQAARRGVAAGRLDPDRTVDLLDKVIFNARRTSAITERIRGFIRPAALDPGPVDLGKVTREVVDLLGPELRRHEVQVLFQDTGAPVVVQGDAIQLSQVVLNLLRNALDAVLLVRQRTIRIQLLQGPGEAGLQVQDSGPGLDPRVADRVGIPYVTTKAEGLGLGLSISNAILQQHQGRLSLSNAPEGGACADIRLPLVAVRAEVA